MTTPTTPAAALTVQTSDVRHNPAQRDRMMHATAAVEDVLGALQGGTPSNISLSTDQDGTVRVTMTCGAEVVREFATCFGAEPRLISCLFGEGAHWYEADAIVRGVAVKAGHLTSTQPAEATDPCHPCGCPKRFNRHAWGCPTQSDDTLASPTADVTESHGGES
ncbi:hypothetical protein [Streptomyces sp. t39]|uniref:hypothetical protein n=1 Tax=Streptomyces sp. t39 TaxID=1828156 RepID=UPI0011CD5721|nr:hypothetical protein [Streptomyces sp. t39]TXS55222.1 hypothetical protein EAO77_02675 [Streptomyces sp. t39]